MIPKKITVLKIEPQTHVRSTKGDSWLFAVTDEYLMEYDQKRTFSDPDAKPGRNMNRKRQLQKYNAYKEDLRWQAKNWFFTVPDGYFAIWFYVPHPKSWRPKKVKEMLYKPHQNTPDCDNMVKSFLDSLMPRRNRTKGAKGADDRKVHCYAPFKVWVLPGEECIKILEYNANDYTKEFEHGLPNFYSI
jgi:Holliday junction resolvase RusA-like endonuclease